MSGDMERLLQAARGRLEELNRRARDYTTTPLADPVRIAVYHYQYVGGADIVAALEAELRAIQHEQQQTVAD